MGDFFNPNTLSSLFKAVTQSSKLNNNVGSNTGNRSNVNTQILEASLSGPLPVKISGGVTHHSNGEVTTNFKLDVDVNGSPESDVNWKWTHKNSDTDSSVTSDESDVTEYVNESINTVVNNIFPGSKTSKNKTSKNKANDMSSISYLFKAFENMSTLVKSVVPENEEFCFKTNSLETKIQNQINYDINCISGQYSNHLDLNRIDKLILKKLEQQNPKYNSLLQEKQELTSNNSIHSDRINKINLELDRLDLTKYENLVSTYLQQFQNLNNTESNSDVKLNIILNYLDIARRYIAINITRDNENKNICPECHLNLENIYPDNQSCLTCPECGSERCYLQTNDTPRDRNQSTKTDYSDIENFIKSLDQYSGTQKVVLPLDLEYKLDIHFQKKGIPKGFDIRQLYLIGKFEGRRKRGYKYKSLIKSENEFVDIDMLYQALHDTRNADYYKDRNLITHVYWGWELPDISYYRDRLIKDYQVVQPEYNKIRGDEKKSSISTDYRSFRQLWHIGYPCHPSDFKMITTTEIISYYEKIWEEIVNKVGKQLHWKPFIKIDVLYRMNFDTLELPNINSRSYI